MLGTPESQPLLSSWTTRDAAGRSRQTAPRINHAQGPPRWLHPAWPFREQDRDATRPGCWRADHAWTSSSSTSSRHFVPIVPSSPSCRGAQAGTTRPRPSRPHGRGPCTAASPWRATDASSRSWLVRAAYHAGRRRPCSTRARVSRGALLVDSTSRHGARARDRPCGARRRGARGGPTADG